MAKLVFVNNDEEFDIDDGSEITEACEEAGVPFACGGEGICGSCIVEVVEGMKNLTPPTEEEKDFLGEDVATQRLACQCRILKNTVKLRF